MKKVLTFVLCMILVIGCLTVSALAAGTGALTVTAGATEVSVGDTVNFSVYLDPAGISGGVKSLQFDVVVPAGLEFVSGSGAVSQSFVSATGSVLSMFNEANNRVVVSGIMTPYAGEAIAVATFSCKVVAETDLSVSLASAVLADGSSASQTPAVSGVTLTIKAPECQHTNTTVENAKEATCSVEGYTGDTVCSDCGATTKGEVIPKMAHTLTVENAKEATCSAEGYTGDTVCSVCGETTKGEAIAKKEHNWNWVIDKEATAKETGLKHEECSVCGEKRNENTVIPATGEGLDDVPQTSDITLTILPITALILAIAVFTVIANKRRAVK